MPHSYSEYGTWKQCARKHHHSYNERRPRGPQHPAAARGDAIHQSIDNYCLEQTEQLHPDIHEQYGQFIWNIRNDFTCKPEHKFAFDVNWKKVAYKSPKAWVRGKLDLLAVAEDEVVIYEWKTGKVYDDHIQQRYLYGLVGLLLFPQIPEVEVQGVYFDQGDHPPVDTYHRDGLDFMKEEWSTRFRLIEEDEIHATNPSYLCKFCDFSKAKGGPCSF